MTRDFYNYFVSLVEDDSILQTRDGTGQDFLDPTRPINFKIIAG